MVRYNRPKITYHLGRMVVAWVFVNVRGMVVRCSPPAAGALSLTVSGKVSVVTYVGKVDGSCVQCSQRRRLGFQLRERIRYQYFVLHVVFLWDYLNACHISCALVR